MIVESKVPSFGVTASWMDANKAFGFDFGIVAFVEGFDDIRFWTKEFNKQGIEVTVKAVSDVSNANGKGTILSSLKDGTISLSDKSLICIDSDYDYLLSKNKDLYDNDFCFQTYAYSIENYLFYPKGLTYCCCHAAGHYSDINKNILEEAFNEWSKYYHDTFIMSLNDQVDNSPYVEIIIESLSKLNIDNDYGTEIKYEIEQDILENFSSKGLRYENIYLYYQGHAIADKIIPLAKDLVDKISFIAKDIIIKRCEARGVDSGQLVGEYYNKRQEVEIIARSREDFPDEQCYQLLKHDISEYKRKYCS